MMGLENLFKLYVPLVSWVGLGLLLGWQLPKSVPLSIGKFLFWVGVPLSIAVFLRQADLSASVWVAPFTCWLAISLGAGLAALWIRSSTKLSMSMVAEESATDSRSESPPCWRQRLGEWLGSERLHRPPSQGSFLLAAMIGNTGYLGYPVTLTLVGPEFFGWAVFYDTLGSTLGAYGLGVMLAARFGSSRLGAGQLWRALLINPALWSFWIGLALRPVALPASIEQGLKAVGWGIIALSLLLLGMRLSQLTSWRNLHQATVSLAIKMLIVPLTLGLLLPLLGITGLPKLVLILQMAMPPAFATLVIAEAYNLDRELTVTTLALGSGLLLLLLPLWLWLFAP